MTARKKIIVALIFVLYVAAVWICAGFLTEGTTFLAIGLVLTACGATILGVYILVSRLSPPAPAPASAPDREVRRADAASPFATGLRAFIADANLRLSKSAKVGSRRFRTTVTGSPLYIVAGLEDTGKTSTIHALGMGVEQLSGQIDANDRVAKTRLANFWFADGAILAEIAGQSFNTAAEWQQFLESLAGGQAARAFQRMSKRDLERNLRGVLLFCDCADFLGAPDAARQNAAVRLLQDRLRAVGEVFQCNFPVYIVLSKADKIPFFQDYFGRLLEAEDQQVLGCTLPRTPSQTADHGKYAESQAADLSDAFNSLYLSLTDKRMTFLAREHDPVRKPGIYEFPRELKRIRGNLVQFLVEVFRPNALQPGPMLRGFYFTAVRQVPEGSAAVVFSDGPVMTSFSGEATRLLKMEDLQNESQRPAPAPKIPKERLVLKWAFITQLFRDVILGDLRAAPVSYGNRRMDVMSLAAVVVVGLLCFAFAAASARSWFNNRALLEDLQAAAALPPKDPDSAISSENLRRLAQFRQIIENLEAYRRSTPFSLGMFLYAGNSVLRPATQKYFTWFQEYLLDDVVQEERATLSKMPGAPAPDYPYQLVYDRLKAYLMISSGSCAPDARFLPQPLTDVWYERRPDANAADAYRAELRKQFEFYAVHLASFSSRNLEARPAALDVPKEAEPVERAQAYLNSFGRERRIYNDIVQSVSNSSAPVRLIDYSRNYPAVLRAEVDQIPGAFTRAGWKQVFEQIEHPKPDLGESCVLGADQSHGAADSDLSARLRDLYLAEYSKRWRNFVQGIKLLGFRDSGDAASKLQALAQADSPILGALFMVNENAQVVTPVSKTPFLQQAESKAPGLLDRLSHLGALKETAKAKMKEAVAEERPSQVDMAAMFQPVRSLFNPDASRGRWVGDANRKYVDSLQNMAAAMSALRDSPAPTDVTLNGNARNAHDEGLHVVSTLNYGFDRDSDKLSPDHADIAQSVRTLLESPFLNTDGKFVKDPGKAEAGKINGALVSFCNRLKPLLAKFPFRNGGDAVSIAELNSVFAPQKSALAELTQNLSSVVQRVGVLWQQAPTAPPGMQVDPEFLRAFNRLWAITDALYQGQPDPRLDFKITPSPNPDVQSIKAVVNGQTLTGSPWPVMWPNGANGNFQVFVANGSLVVPCGDYLGPWAAFRFILDARHAGGDSEFVDQCFSRGVGGGQSLVTALKFRVEGPRSVLDPGFFGVGCPKRVVGQH